MTDRHTHLGVRRRWVKLWTQQTLHGTTSQELEPAERWVWCGFLCLAGDSPCPGTICVAEGVPYNDEQLARILRVDLRLLGSAISRMKAAGKIETNGDGIHICNWEHYDSIGDRALEGRRYLSTHQRRRLRIMQRDGLLCRLCGHPIKGSSDVEMDHIIPRSRGGASDDSNLQIAHGFCNRVKGTRDGLDT